jgi:hypothetical protein
MMQRLRTAPHLVRDGRKLLFYRRNNAGNQPMDWHDIRGAFVAGEAQRDRIERFRNDRVGKIASDSLGFKLTHSSHLVLHVFPIAAVGGESVVDVPATVRKHDKLRPLFGGGYSCRAAFEGVLVYDQKNDGSYSSYTLLFREGLIEAVGGDFARLRTDWKRPLIASQGWEERVLERLPHYIDELKQLGCSPPLLVMITATGVLGAAMAVPRDLDPFDEGQVIDRDALVVPPVILNSFDERLDIAMKPAFDAIWNAAGWAGSLNYDEEPRWMGIENLRRR